MNCWHCNTELIWGSDHDISHEDDTYIMVTNLSCPECESIVDVYLPSESTFINLRRKKMFDYSKFGHMTKQELLLNLKQYDGTGVTYKICDPDFDGDDQTIVFSFSKEEDDGKQLDML